MIAPKKAMVSAFFTREGFISVESLPDTDRFNSTIDAQTVLPSIVRFVRVFRPKMHGRCYWMHIDNAKPHNSAFSPQKIEVLGFT
jgi:hypothetical protein